MTQYDAEVICAYVATNPNPLCMIGEYVSVEEQKDYIIVSNHSSLLACLSKRNDSVT